VVPLALASLILLAPSLVAGSATPVPVASGIPPVVWQLVGFTEPDRAPTTIDDPSRYLLQFLPEGLLLAQFDCTQGYGGYTAAEGALTLRPMAVTTARCPPDAYATTLWRLLGQCTSYRFDPEVGDLLLRGDAGVVRLQPVLSGVVWQWQGNVSNTGEVTGHPDQPKHYTLEFLPEGMLAIQADCSHVMGTYIVTGSQLDLQRGGVTRMACLPGSLMDPFLHDLDGAVSYSIQQGILLLALSGGNGVMRFAPVVDEAATATPGPG
jgi:heat shock protein HslJ